MKLLAMAPIVLLIGCDEQFECRIIPDREAERAEVDNTARMAHSIAGEEYEPPKDLVEARKTQDEIDEIARELNAKHGC